MDLDADNLSAKIKVGYAAGEVAPDIIDKQPAGKIPTNMQLVYSGGHTVPPRAWLILINKTCREH